MGERNDPFRAGLAERLLCIRAQGGEEGLPGLLMRNIFLGYWCVDVLMNWYIFHVGRHFKKM